MKLCIDERAVTGASLLFGCFLISCGDVPSTSSDLAADSPGQRTSRLLSIGNCTGTTPAYDADVYSAVNFGGDCTRIHHYSVVGDTYTGFVPRSVKVGPRTIINLYSQTSWTGPVLATIGNSYMVQSWANLYLFYPSIRSYALVPTGSQPGGGIGPLCTAGTTAPGPHDMILYTGTYYTGFCAVFSSDGYNYSYFPDMATFGWSTAYSYPISSIQMGSAANTTAFQYINYNSMGHPPGLYPAGWSFPTTSTFASAYMN
jgi:hypothetical protein